MIWYDTLTGDALTPSSDFAGFAAATVESAVARFGFGSSEHAAVLEGWSLVGINTKR